MFTIVYQRGCNNLAVDTLSQLPGLEKNDESTLMTILTSAPRVGLERKIKIRQFFRFMDPSYACENWGTQWRPQLHI